MKDEPNQFNGVKDGLSGSNGYHRSPVPLRPKAHRPMRRWQDIVTLLLGVWLFLTPWVWPGMALVLDPSFPGESAWAAWIPGAVIVVMALWGLARPLLALPECVSVGVGAWMVIAPCLPGFARLTSLATWNQWAVGLLVCVLSLWAM